MKTVLVTGGSGYIGSWLVKYLLEEDIIVRITVRDKSNKNKVDFLQRIAEKSKGKLEIWQADLLKDGSFNESMQGVDTVFHVASPFMLKVKSPQTDLIDPALRGTENVLNAVNKSETVRKVILTSSVAAIHGDNIDMKEKGLQEFTENQWNSSSSLNHQPYSYSKTIAEQKAWEIANSQKRWQLVVINPSFVIGPSLSKSSDSYSLQFVNELLSGKMATGAPDLMFGFVDVRDVAKAHILAAKISTAEGRHLLAERTMGVLDLAKIISNNFPGKYKMPKIKAPKFLMYLMGPLFGVTGKFVSRNVGHKISLNNSKSINSLGLVYTKTDQSIVDMINEINNL